MDHIRLPRAPLAAAAACAAALLAAGACRSTAGVEPRLDPALCPQTYEFGNFGCARVVAQVEASPQPSTTRYRFDVRLVPARPDAGVSLYVAPMPGPGPVPLQLTLYSPLMPRPVDTLSVWVVGRLLDDSPPPPVNAPLPTLAADSVLRVLRFAPVGARPAVDTVRLDVRRR
jgi:hypothetical protein